MKRIERTVQILILLFLIYYSLFYKLDTLAYRIWDEARLATSAYEMTKTGNLLITSIDYLPDMVSLKPPLMILAQATCIKLNGLNEYSTRLPAAICALFTILLIFIFITHLTKNRWAALLGGIIFCTAHGVIGYHGARFGEYDSMLTFFTTSYLLAFYMYTETQGEQKNKFLILFFVAITLAVFTKGIAGLLFCPALLIYLLVRKQFLSTLANPVFYIGVSGFIFLVAGYCFYREYHTPGFLYLLNEYELTGRMLNTIDAHYGSPNYYLNLLKFERFATWFWGIPTSLLLFLCNKNPKHVRTSLFFLLCAFSFIAILSMGNTKIWWYDLPSLPLFAIAISILIIQLGNIATSLFPFIKYKIALLLLILIFSIQPVYEMHNYLENQVTVLNPKMDWGDIYPLSYYLRNAITQNDKVGNSIYLYKGFAYQWKLYIYELNERGKNIFTESLTGQNNFKSGVNVIANQEETKSYIESNYDFQLIEKYYNVKFYKIIRRKVVAGL